MSQKLQQLLDVTQRQHQPFALLAIELTNYAELLKKYNRDTADRALVMAAVRIRSNAEMVRVHVPRQFAGENRHELEWVYGNES